MDIVSETAKYGVTERRFDLKVDDELVPGVMWLPEGATGGRPKVLFGHGGSQHKKVPHFRSFAKRLAAHGWASAAIDAPQHGDRLSAEERALPPEDLLKVMQKRVLGATGEERKARAAMAVKEWKATIDALEALDEVGVGPTGYWGVSMGTMFGVPLVAAEPRIQCAVLGLGGLGFGGKGYEAAANSIAIPLQFMLQSGDELVPLESGIGLYDAFGSEEKMLVVNPGAHAAVPPFMFEINDAFFQRHLSS
ncbi:MAG: hypothetical protein QOF21_1212 [Actinomycetota bacterium]|jgi:dienelactone hydrolase